MKTVRECVRGIINDLRVNTSEKREFLNKTKDLSVYDVDILELPIINKTITTEEIKKMVKKEGKKRTMVKKEGKKKIVVKKEVKKEDKKRTRR